jgi:NADP-reducing hydrogenase subunit HndB
MKLKIEDLDTISERMQSVTKLREGSSSARINVHLGTCGIASGARDILSTFLSLIEENAKSDIIITTSGCAGLCSREPMATVELRGETPVKYVDLNSEKAKRIFKEHVLGGKPVIEYALAVGSERIS